MNLFSFSEGTSLKFSISGQFWIYVCVSVPLTLMTVGLWLWMSRRHKRKRSTDLEMQKRSSHSWSLTTREYVFTQYIPLLVPPKTDRKEKTSSRRIDYGLYLNNYGSWIMINLHMLRSFAYLVYMYTWTLEGNEKLHTSANHQHQKIQTRIRFLHVPIIL